jgi:predicted RNA-binding Zn ribbon-like protein
MVRTVTLIESSVQPGGRAPAHEPLELVQAFVNTVDREHGPDLFDRAGDLAAWAARRDLVLPPDLDAARAVREALRALLWENTGAVPDDPSDAFGVPAAGTGSLAVLDRAAGDPAAVLDAAAASLRPRFSPPRLEGADAVAAVLSATFLAMADGSWRRLKACPGHRCGWAFYDRSVNGSATWCSMRICGNRAKTRAYYRRRR